MAGKGNVVSKVREIIAPYLEELGLDLWDIQYRKEGTERYLRIFIDKDGGVGVDDCVDLSHAITKPLDEADPISESYTLEVSSPGIERELVQDEHFKKFIGADVMMRTIRPIDGARDFCGKLADYSDGVITLQLEDGSSLTVNKKETAYVKLDDFDINDFQKDID